MKRFLLPAARLPGRRNRAPLPLGAPDGPQAEHRLHLADDLGYTDVACYGSRYYETPNIDRLAAQGMRFTDGYTCGPNCRPTRAALMSEYGPRTGVYTVGGIDRFNWQSQPLRPVDNVNQLPLEKVTLAQSLKKAGYATALFGKWHLGDNGPHHHGQRGFDEAIVSAASTSTSKPARRRPIPRALTWRISSRRRRSTSSGGTRKRRSISRCTTSASTRRTRPRRR